MKEGTTQQPYRMSEAHHKKRGEGDQARYTDRNGPAFWLRFTGTGLAVDKDDGEAKSKMSPRENFRERPFSRYDEEEGSLPPKKHSAPNPPMRPCPTGARTAS